MIVGVTMLTVAAPLLPRAGAEARISRPPLVAAPSVPAWVVFAPSPTAVTPTENSMVPFPTRVSDGALNVTLRPAKPGRSEMRALPLNEIVPRSGHIDGLIADEQQGVVPGVPRFANDAIGVVSPQRRPDSSTPRCV